ncbi:Arginine N-methyltransferase 2 [Paramarasmius palmivorus]|uniref:Arginine N-methyltransferase 2 n=1 Tax=Paramarasmius palmivorus TaxID=297713 RepID=A0AAW0DQE9_9AGAR
MDTTSEDVDELAQLGETLISMILQDEPVPELEILIKNGAPLWYANESEGLTALHAAAYMRNEDLVRMLIKEGALWNAVDHLNNTAGDIALSFNDQVIYTLIRDYGLRSELLLTLLSSKKTPDPPSSLIIRGHDASAAGSTDTFLKSKLTFTIDEYGQEICTVKAGDDEVGVMMAWEQGIMEKTVALLCKDHSNADNLRVLNIGHGLGIIDTLFQNLSSTPALHCIVEAHPDVLRHMKDCGWYDKPGVRIVEGKWQAYRIRSRKTITDGVLRRQDVVPELFEMGGFDIVYTDTFSENYADLREFFEHLPDLLSGPDSRFSFFNGLGATNALFYDVYTHLSEVHLAEIGVDIEWHDVDVGYDGDNDRWGQTRQYFTLPLYRLPIGQMVSDLEMFARSGTRRNANEIVLHLSPTQAPPSTVPFEIQNQITIATWEVRIGSILAASARYSKPWFERIWFIIALASLIIVPVALQPLIYKTIVARDQEGFVTPQSLAEANAILFGVFLGTLLLFLIPISVWKFIGHRQLSGLVQRWTKADQVEFGKNVACSWTVKSPGMFRDGTILMIGLPASATPSSFHPNAYLPSYVNGPVDADASYYYPYKAEPGLPRMSVVGNIPLYVDEKRAFKV